MSSPVSTDGNVESYVEMFLKPASTGVYDWTAIPAPLRSGDVLATDGNGDLNDTPGVPNRLALSLHDPDGDFNRKNPMGLYYGSIGLGVQTRAGAWCVDDQCARTVADTNWGTVGNIAGDAWTAGSSSGGTVTAGDWSVSGGTARHSIPAAGAYRWSELSKTTRIHRNIEVRRPVTVPTNNVTGTGALASEVWMRTVDVNTNVVVSVAFQVDETVQIALADKIAGVSRYLLNYTTVPGLNLATTGVDYELRCQVENSTVRAKIWQAGTPEPIGWQVTGYGATIRAGYLGIADFVFAGNTNTKPLIFQTPLVQVRIPVFAGEIVDLNTTGDDKSEPKITDIKAAGLMDRLQNQAAPAESVMRRSRSRPRRWLYIGSVTAASTAADARTFTTPTASLGNVTIGDFFYLVNPTTGLRKEDTQFTIAGGSVAGANTNLLFTPDAREPVAAGDRADVFRGLTQTQQPVAYWPCEDEENSTQVSSGLVGGVPLSISGPSPDFASESGFLCSKSVLKVNDAELRALIPEYTTTATAMTISFLLSMPSSDEAATGTDLVQWYTSGTGFSYDLRYTSGGNGSFQLLVFNSALTLLYDTGTIDFGLRGNKQLVTLTLEQVGGTVTYRLFTVKTDGSTGGVGPTTITGVTTLGKISEIRANPGGGYSDVGYGHLTVAPGVWGVNEVFYEFTAWANRAALPTLQRLAFEEGGLPITYRDDWDVVTTNVGAQKVDTIPNLIRAPATADGGFLHGCRGAVALEYITRGALTNQTAAATFTAADCKDLELLADYTRVANRVSVTRDGGTTVTVEKTTGSLSTQDAPNGVGLRETSYRLSLGGDIQVENHANWRLGIGTLDQYRVPKVTITSAGTSTVSLETLLSISVGDRIDITGLTALDVYDTLAQLVVGVRIRLGDRFYPRVELTCVPADIFNTLALTGDRYSRPDLADTTTGSTLTTTQTGSLTLASASGSYLLTVDAADFPLDVMIGGERLTLSSCVDTAVAGVQTAQISVRSVNNVIKAHVVGEEVVLAEPNYWQFR